MFDPSRVAVVGPLASYAPGFVAELAGRGYTPLSATLQLRLCAQLSRWLALQNLGVIDLVGGVGERFFAERRASGAQNYRTVRSLAPLWSYLDELGVLPAAPAPPPDPVEDLLARYRSWLFGERGLAVSTARGYADLTRPFVASRLRPAGLDLAGLSAADVVGFVLAAAPGRARGSAKLLVCSLRSLLGFLHVEGLIPAPLAGVVPSVAGSRLAGLPRGLEPAEVVRLLAACDRRRRAGLRDYAIVLLLVRLGLRAGEVADLLLDDIDWRAAEIVVRGKGARAERLPLPVDVGQAVADYLRRGRPATARGRSVFVRIKAPHRQLTSGAVTDAVHDAGLRAGLDGVFAHRLRHTTATATVRAGASLAEVGQLLRHRRALTTAIYVKVDREALRTLALPWPGDPEWLGGAE